MRFKDRLVAAFSGSGKKRSNERPARTAGLEEGCENDSPLVPKRLLSPLAGSERQAARGRQLADLTSTGTPRALNYEASPAPRSSRLQRDSSLQREPSLQRGSSAKPPPMRVGSTPARTPRMPSRFGVPAAHDAAATTGANGSAPMDDDTIRVVLRVRPRNERETTGGGGVCVQPLSASGVRVASHPEPHSFSFDYVAGDATTQETIFRVAGKPIVENCLSGYNGCIFAYGQTGSGKTYTMLGGDEVAEDGHVIGPSGHSRDDSRGLIQRVFEHLFARMAEAGGKHLLECSFLEIYNETITDLLDPSRTNLQVRENLEGQYVSGLTAREVYRVEDVVSLLTTGQANRRVGETNMNERSSRSHSVFTCKLQSKTVDQYGTTHVRCSRLHLVDLAGSERQKASGAQGERLKEATAINKSLSALGNVIMSLVDQQHGRQRHIPYRDSRLTYLLQDSLGGNAKTCLVATVSPAAINMAETLSTLRFADQAKRIKNQAVVNEDTDGDKAALKREIKRLMDELAAARRMGAQQPQLGAAGDQQLAPAGSGEALGTGTPTRLAAQADALLAASSPGMGQEGVARRQALMGALRREDAAVKVVRRLEGELEGMRGLLKAKESDLQRTQMIMKLKESRLARLQSGVTATDAPAEVAELQQEIELLRAKVDAHPDVKRFAVENIRLSEEVKKYEGIVQRGELVALHADVDGLRGEMLRLEEEWRRAQEESAAAQEAAVSARMEADAAAEAIRAKATAEAQAKAAIELSQLRQQLFEQQRAAREAEGAMTAAARDNEELQARVALLQGTVVALESTHAELRQELSPVRKQARQYEHELGLARQESQVAEMRATSEHTLRGQAELASVALQARVAALEAECTNLRNANQELFRAKSDAEEQRDSAVGIELELEGLKAQLEREQAAAVERQADHVDALTQLDSSRQRAGELEAEAAASQREALDARTELQRQQAEHEAERTAAAERIAAALKAAAEVQTELEARAGRVQELQAEKEKLQVEADDLTQRCTQLHNENVHLASMLAQRDNEMLELEQTIEDREGELAAQKQGTEKLAGILQEAQAALAAKDDELASVVAELEAARAKLADATAAMQDAHEQLSELQERLTAAEAQQAEVEYELSDKSASLTEAREQLAEAKRQLADAQAAAMSGAAAEEKVAAELEAAHSRAAELATDLAGRDGQLEAAREEAEAHREAAEAARKEAEEQRAAAEAARKEAEGTAVALRALQTGALAEKEQALILGRAEVKELRQQLAEQEQAAEKLRAQLAARGAEAAQLRHDMAAEVSEAAQQVQQLLAAQGRCAVLENELAAARAAAEEAAHREAAQAPLQVAEAVAAARADARVELDRLEGVLAQREAELGALRRELEESSAEMAQAANMTTAQAQEQIEHLISEREAWIEEVQAQRAEASAAVEASRALERRFGELAEERSQLAAALEEVRERATKLEDELTHLTGQQNLNQRIQYHKKIKDENSTLREELGRLRIDTHRTHVRYERATQELQKLRGGLPDWDAEEALREALVAAEAQKAALEGELQALAASVLALAGGASGSTSSSAAPAGAVIGSADGIELELGTPRPHLSAAAAAGPAAGAAPRDVGAAARRALADISAQQAAATRSLEDQRQQIRLLKESSKLAQLRRGSVRHEPAQQQQP